MKLLLTIYKLQIIINIPYIYRHYLEQLELMKVIINLVYQKYFFDQANLLNLMR